MNTKIGHKSTDNSFFIFKHNLTTTEKRIIISAVIISEEKGDGSILPELIEQSQNNGITVDTIIGDTAYSGKKNLALDKEKKISLTTTKTQIYLFIQQNTCQYEK